MKNEIKSPEKIRVIFHAHSRLRVSATQEAGVTQEARMTKISQELLDMLVCPVCKTPVKLTLDEQGLRCHTCHIIYPVRDGFPVMIRDEAFPEPPELHGPPESLKP